MYAPDLTAGAFLMSPRELVDRSFKLVEYQRTEEFRVHECVVVDRYEARAPIDWRSPPSYLRHGARSAGIRFTIRSSPTSPPAPTAR
jgi:hypothetical protein